MSNILAAGHFAGTVQNLLVTKTLYKCSAQDFALRCEVREKAWRLRCIKPSHAEPCSAWRWLDALQFGKAELCYYSQVRNALNCAFREKTYSLKCKNPFAHERSSYCNFCMDFCLLLKRSEQ